MSTHTLDLRKRTVSMILSAAMVCSLFPAPSIAFAAEGDEPAGEELAGDAAAEPAGAGEEPVAAPAAEEPTAIDEPDASAAPEAGNPAPAETPAEAATPDQSERPARDQHLHGVVGAEFDDEVRAPSIHDANEEQALYAQATLPSSFDPRGKGLVTSVRNQGRFSNCWAFAVTAALESSMLARGQWSNASTLDLSERHLTYFAYHGVDDALQNLTGDLTVPLGTSGVSASDLYLETANTASAAARCLASWAGPANESVAPYDVVPSNYEKSGYGSTFFRLTNLSEDLARTQNVMHLDEYRFVPMTDREDVKRAIMDYGGGTLAIRFDWDYCFDDEAYFYPKSGGTTHIVEVVGWDDNFDRYQFSWYDSKEDYEEYAGPDEVIPDRNGAWLIKNSWGTYNHDGGYFWLSYEDVVANDQPLMVLGVSPTSNFDNLYQYDGTYGYGGAEIASGGSIANVFEAKANSAGAERLEAVSFIHDDVNVDYSIQVYLNPSNASDPTSGTAALASPVTGKTTYAGLYTVNLPEPVDLREGSRFAVVVTLSHSDGSDVYYTFDSSFSNNYARYESKVAAGQSFVRNGGGTWTDLAKTTITDDNGTAHTNCCARIKAYTQNIEALPESPVEPGQTAPRKLQIAKTTITVSSTSVTYTGKRLEPAVQVWYGTDLRKGTDYTVAYTNNTNVGTATVTITGKGGFEGTKTATFKITQASNPMKVKGKTVKLKAKKVKKKKQTIKKGTAFTVTSPQGKVTFKKSSGNKGITVSKTGTVSVKKGLKKGTYKVKVKVTAAGNKNYKSLAKTVTMTVKIS